MAEFTSYESVRPWAEQIKENVTLRKMPPWSADPAHSLKFRNDPRLSDADVATIEAWVNAGALKGKDAGLLDPPLDSTDWRGPGGRKPDLVISMNKDVTVPARGDLPYVRFLMPLTLKEDKWVEAVQTRPGNASVVHHMAITEVELPNGVPAADVDALEDFNRKMGVSTPVVRPVVGPHGTDVIDMLGIYTPGSTLEEYYGDSAKLLRGGANRFINFNIHYAGSGTSATDRSEVAFWFRDTPPKHQIYRVAMAGGTIIANGTELLTDTPGEKAEGTHVPIPAIPAGDSNYELVSITAFPRPVTIFQLHPHAHLRARDFRYDIFYPDGHEETLLSIPKYDFHWQLAYDLATPLKVPAGSKMVVTAHYDNSAGNEDNPDPGQAVFFRAQNRSTDEMFSPFIQYSVDTEDPANSSGPANEPAAAPIVETTGCLVPSSADRNWTLTNALLPVPVQGEASDSMAMHHARQTNPGNERLPLVGLTPFKPERYRGEKVLIRALKIATAGQLNVTSLLEVSKTCQ
jgi:hypothetical protein